MRLSFFGLMVGFASIGAASAQEPAPSVMKQCGDKWQAAKAAGTTGDVTWTQFLSGCRADIAAQPASATTAPAPAAAPTANAAAPSNDYSVTQAQCAAVYEAAKAAGTIGAITQADFLKACAVSTVPPAPAKATDDQKPPSAGAAPAGDPLSILTDIYRRAVAQTNPGPARLAPNWLSNKADRQRYLSKSLLSLWARSDAAVEPGTVGAIDFDVITGTQGPPPPKGFSLATESQSEKSATVAVTLSFPPRSFDSSVIRYDFVREEQRWKIDEIRGEKWSIRKGLVYDIGSANDQAKAAPTPAAAAIDQKSATVTAPNASPIASPDNYADQFAFCQSIKDADDPTSKGYNGPLPPTAQDGSAVWRCMDGFVYGCHTGMSGPGLLICDKPKVVTTPTTVIKAYCAEHPGSNVPNAANDTTSSWICRGPVADIDKNYPTPPLDKRGYIASYWTKISPPSQQPATDVTAPPPAPAATPTHAAPAANVPTASRAAMFVTVASDPQKPAAVSLGTVVWSSIPAVPGQPATVGVRADADIPDLKIHAIMTIRKNTDPSFAASHTIDLRVTFSPGADIKGVKDMSVPMMRRENPAAQDALAGGRVKISDSYFLVGLNHADADAARNVNLIATRGWFDFPLVLNDDRLAKLTFEKGEAGDHVLSQALSVWKTAENPNAAQPTPAKIAAVLVAGVTRTEGIAL